MSLDSPVRVLLVDDDALVRAGLRAILGGAPEIEVVGEAADGAEGVGQVAALAPDVVLMDIRMPVLDGVAATKEILAAWPDANVIMLTMYRQDHYVFEAIKAGASGYLLKDADADRLTDAVRRVHSGETLLNADLAKNVLDEFRKYGKMPNHPEHKLSELTAREEDILRLLAQGHANLEIADQLGVSEKTVRNRLTEIFSKLRLNNRTQAALYALREGIATLEPGGHS